MKRLDTNINAQRAITLKVNDPSLKWNQIAKQIGVSKDTVYKWTQDTDFINAFSNRAMELIKLKTPEVAAAVYESAKEGNVSAQRLFLEMSNNLNKTININHHAPADSFQKYLLEQDDVEEAEIEYIEEVEVPIAPMEKIEQKTVKEKTKQETLHDAKKRASYNLKQKEWRLWKKRAKAVGVEPLSGGRPTVPQRKAWENEIKKKEEQQRQG